MAGEMLNAETYFKQIKLWPAPVGIFIISKSYPVCTWQILSRNCSESKAVFIKCLQRLDNKIICLQYCGVVYRNNGRNLKKRLSPFLLAGTAMCRRQRGTLWSSLEIVLGCFHTDHCVDEHLVFQPQTCMWCGRTPVTLTSQTLLVFLPRFLLFLAWTLSQNYFFFIIFTVHF